MSISTEEKDRYLRETAIVLAREGFQTGKTDTGKLRVLLDGAPLCEVTENGGITYRNEDIKAVQDNKPFIMNVYHSVSREQVENYLYKVTYDLLEGVVEEQAQGMSVRDEDKAFIATVYKYAFVGLMLDWIKNDMKGDPQLLVDRLELVIHGNVRAALERLRIDKA